MPHFLSTSRAWRNYSPRALTTPLDEPRPARRRRLWQLALCASVAVALGKNACIHSFCSPERNAALGPPVLASGDEDLDGLADAEENTLARRFAPIVVLDERDIHRPASIGWLLAKADIFRDRPRAVLAGSAEIARDTPSLPHSVHTGSENPRDWTTYVHVYPRPDGGINLQYWFFYPYSNGPLFFDHDSDWEHLTIVLDSLGTPLGAHLAQHENDHPGRFHEWSQLRSFQGQPVVFSARGTHATYARPEDTAWYEDEPACKDPAACPLSLWKSWEGGGLENLGERGRPLRVNRALSFSARWGGTGLVPGTSAPYGPLFHRGFCVDGVWSCLDEVGAHFGRFAGTSGMLTSSAADTTNHSAP